MRLFEDLINRFHLNSLQTGSHTTAHRSTELKPNQVFGFGLGFGVEKQRWYGFVELSRLYLVCASQSYPYRAQIFCKESQYDVLLEYFVARQ